MTDKSRARLTFVVIPEAERPVRQVRLCRRTLTAVSFVCLALLAAAAVWLRYEYDGWLSLAARLSEQIAVSRQGYERSLPEKEATIARLQSELRLLSLQAEEVRRELERLQDFEQELRRLTGLSPAESSESLPGSGITASSPSGVPLSAAVGGGAPFSPNGGSAAPQSQSVSAVLSASAHRMLALRASFEHLRDFLLEDIRTRNHTPSIWPVRFDTITSSFGYRRDPFTGRLQDHHGIDLAADPGEPVFATADGVVEEAGWDAQKGNYILVFHSYGLHTQYMHLSKRFVEKGDNVTKGQTIGLVGSTGRSTGPHLHYEVWEWRKAVDPAAYLPSTNGSGGR